MTLAVTNIFLLMRFPGPSIAFQALNKPLTPTFNLDFILFGGLVQPLFLLAGVNAKKLFLIHNLI